MCCLISVWILFTVPLTFVLLAVFRERADSNPPTGLCPVCGYDLRATPYRCPECGHIPPRSETARAAAHHQPKQPNHS